MIRNDDGRQGTPWDKRAASVRLRGMRILGKKVLSHLMSSVSAIRLESEVTKVATFFARSRLAKGAAGEVSVENKLQLGWVRRRNCFQLQSPHPSPLPVQAGRGRRGQRQDAVGLHSLHAVQSRLCLPIGIKIRRLVEPSAPCAPEANVLNQ